MRDDRRVQGTSIVRKVAEYVSFFAQGSCGQCPPCKGGTFQLMRLLDRIDTGRGTRAMRQRTLRIDRWGGDGGGEFGAAVPGGVRGAAGGVGVPLVQ